MTTAPRKTFDAVTTSPKSLQTILQCLSPNPIAKSEFCTIRLSNDGIKVSLGGIRAGWQAAAFIPSNLFSKYIYTPTNLTTTNTDTDDDSDDGDFPLLLQVSLHAFVECLSMFQIGTGLASNSSTGLQRAAEGQRSIFQPIRGTLRLIYEGDGEPFLIIAEENGVVTTCELTTYAPDEDEDTNEIAFNPIAMVSKIIMKSEWLHSALQELNTPSTTQVLTLRTSPRKPHFRLSTTSEWGGAEVDYPNERNVLETFICERPVSNSYRFAAVKMALRAMSASSKVAARTDSEGVLSMNFMVDLEGKNVFVEFRVIANVENGESEED